MCLGAGAPGACGLLVEGFAGVEHLLLERLKQFPGIGELLLRLLPVLIEPVEISARPVVEQREVDRLAVGNPQVGLRGGAAYCLVKVDVVVVVIDEIAVFRDAADVVIEIVIACTSGGNGRGKSHRNGQSQRAACAQQLVCSHCHSPFRR